jgi:ABC-type nitrate/sulfonate/bicarbonate transport system substrate-binding protein
MRRTPLVLAAVAALVAGISVGCGGSGPADQVTLQLNWYHEAEFMGYYVAAAKGFYEDQNLDVTILGGGPPAAPAREQVLSGASTFAITSFAEQRDLVVAGQPVVAVMAAFQIPPLVIFSLADSGIRQPPDLEGKRVGTTTDYWKNILRETLTAAGVDPATVIEVDVEPGQMSLLYDGTVDAWLGYAQDEPIRAEVAGHPVNNIFPADYGIGGYEGLLITLDSTISQKPDLVKRFVQASYDGWRYALEHQDEAAQILDAWAPENGLEFQQLAAHAVAPLVDTPQVPVGWIDVARWQQLMGDAFTVDRPGYTMQFSPDTP